MGRCHFGGQNNHTAKFFIYSKQVDVILVGKIIMPPKLHLLVLLGKQVDVILAGKK
jgi:hypothetical protein